MNYEQRVVELSLSEEMVKALIEGCGLFHTLGVLKPGEFIEEAKATNNVYLQLTIKKEVNS